MEGRTEGRMDGHRRVCDGIDGVIVGSSIGTKACMMKAAAAFAVGLAIRH